MQVTEAIILVGGKGTRLRSVVSDVPKPMARIQDTPFLEILIEDLLAKGITHFVLSVGYMADTIVNYFTQKHPKLHVSFSFENKPLGTGGAIRHAFKQVKGQFALVLNGDSFFDIKLDQLNYFSVRDLPIIFVRHVDDVSRFGKIIYKNNKMVGYFEKQGNGPGYINGGVYVFGKDSLQSFPDDIQFSIERDYLSKLSRENSVTLLFSEDYFIDIGLPESYEKAQVELKPYIRNKALFLDRDGVINVDTGYLHKPQDCVFVDGIETLLKTAKERGYLNIVITNQAGIGRGYYTECEFHNFMSWMNLRLGNLIDDYFFCPFHPKYGVGRYKRDSWDRKPNPGMFENAIQKFNISPLRSIMIGDNASDIQAAEKVNVGTCIHFNPGSMKPVRSGIITELSQAEQLL